MTIQMFGNVVPLADFALLVGFIDEFNSTRQPPTSNDTTLSQAGQELLGGCKRFTDRMNRDFPHAGKQTVTAVCTVEAIAEFKDEFGLDEKLVEFLEKTAVAQEEGKAPEYHECTLCDMRLDIRLTGTATISSAMKAHCLDDSEDGCKIKYPSVQDPKNGAPKMLLCVCGKIYIPAEGYVYIEHKKDRKCIQASRPSLRKVVLEAEEKPLFTLKQKQIKQTRRR